MDFFEAIKNGEIDQVKNALSKDPDLVNSSDEKGASAVLLAAYYRQQSVLDELLSKNPKLNIFEVVIVGKSDELKRMLGEDASQINNHAKDGFSLLGLACYFGHSEIASYLITQGANVNEASHNDFRVAPLHSSVSSGNVEISRLLLENGADPNLAQTQGIMPIHQAAHASDKEHVQMLLEFGADPNKVTEDGKNASDFAQEVKATEIVELLASG